MIKLAKVVREEIKPGAYRFTGTYDDGLTLVLRASATRAYTHAAIHTRSVTTKFRKYVMVNGKATEIDRSERRQFVTFHSTDRVRPANSADMIEQVIAIDAVDSITVEI